MEIENTYIVVRSRAELMVAAKFYAMHGLKWGNGEDLVTGYAKNHITFPARLSKLRDKKGVMWAETNYGDVSDRKEIPIKQATLSLFYES